MKKYIIFTVDIYPVGGMQSYVSSKARYLQENGYEVYVFFDSTQTGDTAFPYLNRFKIGNLLAMSVLPNQILNRDVNKQIEKMKQIIQYSDGDVCYVESQNDKTAIWAELFAKEVKGKHICFNCNEVFRGKNKHYLENIDFFLFKFNRDELYGINEESIHRLFEGVYPVKSNEERVFKAIGEKSVQDVKSDYVDSLPRKDINLCYIGRTDKDCFVDISNGIEKFSREFSSYSILYIVVGELDERGVGQLKQQFSGLRNVEISFAGNLVPIPKGLFGKVNVVLASSGCARLAVEEGACTIIADPNSTLSNGVFGVDTDSYLYSNKQYSYFEVLKNVCINKSYEGKNVTVPIVENKEFYYSNQLRVFDNDSSKNYYPSGKLLHNKRYFSKGTIKFYLKKMKLL